MLPKRTTSVIFLLLVIVISFSSTAPIDDKESAKQAKSAFGPAFDEIVVDTSLTVRRKNGQRQSRTKTTAATPIDKKEENDTGIAATVTAGKREKRQFYPGTGLGGAGIKKNHHRHPQLGANNNFQLQNPAFPMGGAAAANAQAQQFNSFGPLGSFGAQATGAQTQSFNFGPQGINGAAGISAAQVYKLPNGQTIDVSFGGTYSVGPDGKPAVADSSAITITDAKGNKQSLNG